MGDSGSLVVGFLVAIFSVKAATDSQHLTHGLVPLFALAYPLLDTGLAMLRRWLRGVPLSRADRRHIHHQLLSLGLPPTKALFSIYGAAGSVAALGLFAAFAPTEITFVTSIVVLAVLLGIIALSINRLKYHEFAEAGSSLANAARSAPWVIRDKINARDIAALIQGAKTIEDVQEILEKSASLFRLAHMKLATPDSRYRLPSRVSQELQEFRLWKLEYPIVHEKLEDHDALSLTIWCALEGTHPRGAERIAQILGPAIAKWVDTGRMRPATHSYGDRPIRLEYTPRPALLALDRAMLNRATWDPKLGEKSLEA
jgi:UDP-GlcNAc:undecaprenyl-phosphate GlcNAc-1-phosphate transferase